MSEHTMYREIILEECRHPRNCGKLDTADCTECCRNPVCGDEITVHLKLDAAREKVVDVMFEGKGCAISQASASLFTEHIKGRSVADIEKMDEQEIKNLLGIDLNPMRMKCAVLAMRTCAKAIDCIKCGRCEKQCCGGGCGGCKCSK